MDLDELRQVLEAQRQAVKVLTRVVKVAHDLGKRSDVFAVHAARDTEQSRRDLQAIEDARRTLSAFVSGLEDLEDREEELEATRAFDEDVEKIERGQAELIPWEESKWQRRQLR